MKKLYFTLVITSLSFLCVQAQENTANSYIPENFEALKTYIENTNRTHINRIEGKYSSKIKKAFKNQDEKMIEAINDSSYFFHPTIKSNLDAVLQNIYDANPEIDSRDFYFFIKNNVIPNAACYGDGRYEINLGLFTSCKTDDELAFIICHEIAHLVLEHSLKSVTKRYEDLNSKETRKKVSEIKRQRYGRTKAGRLLVDELYIDMLDHSKHSETQADSLGYVLFSKTTYQKNAAVTSLKRLSNEDDIYFDYDVKLDSVFNFKEYPFKSFWLEEETSLFDTDEEIDEFRLSSDTIRTHPEIQSRIDKLKKEFNIKSNDATAHTKNHLDAIKTVIVPQSVQYTIDLKILDLSIYLLIQQFSEELITPEEYYGTMVNVLKQIYVARKNHKLGKYVYQQNSFSDEKTLNDIRRFIHNLELSEIKKIGQAFCNTHSSKITNNEDFKEAFQFFKDLN